ncbi:hypothetical protein AGMMS50256_34100 [Betaproteobacteria bacterium]|nr:hypothetical protein AGMMS50256_34100 [Betaproteobacteria bacterium]
MRNLFRPPLAVLMLCLSLAFAAPSAARTYDNARFGFSVEVNDPDWRKLPPPANGDGMAFQSRSVPDASIVFFARNQIDEAVGIEQEAADTLPDDAESVSKTLTRRSFHIEYEHGDLHTEVRGFLVDGVFHTGLACAPRKALERFRPRFREIFNGWKIHGRPAGEMK